MSLLGLIFLNRHPSEEFIVLSPRKEMEASCFRVQVGQLRLYENDQLMKVAKIIRHPKFSKKLFAPPGADIALLKLDSTVVLSERVHPVSLPAASQKISSKKTCWVAGWGVIEGHSGYWKDPVSVGGTRQKPPALVLTGFSPQGHCLRPTT